MANETLTVTIRGSNGSGKSTLAALIVQALAKAGIVSHLAGDEGVCDPKTHSAAWLLAAGSVERLQQQSQAVAAKTRIEIETTGPLVPRRMPGPRPKWMKEAGIPDGAD